MAGQRTPTPTGPARQRVELAGVPIDRVTETDAINRILTAVARGHGGWVVTPNVDILRKIAHDASLRSLVASADLVLADGMPVVWASRLLRSPVPERVAGSTLLWSLSEAAARAGASVFLLGGNPGVAERASQVLSSVVPTLRVSGHHCPPIGFERSQAELQRIIDEIGAARPAIAFCGFGFPKQEWLIVRLRECFPNTWFIGVGIALSFVAGDVPRCPPWMQSLGLEWLHRLSREPKRLFRRYVVDDIPFAVTLLIRSALGRPPFGSPPDAFSPTA